MSESKEKKSNDGKTYRFSEEQQIKIKNLASELGMSASGVLDCLFSSYELQKGIDLTPEANLETDNIIYHINAIQDAYSHLLSVYSQTKEQARQEYSRTLQNNEQQIADLLSEREVLKQKLNEAEGMYNDVEGENIFKDTTIKELNEAIAEKENALNAARKQIESLTTNIPSKEEYEAKTNILEGEINSLKNSLKDTEKELLETTKSAENIQTELITAKKQAEELQKIHGIEIEKLKNQINNLNQTHDKEKELLLKQADADLKTAVADARQVEIDKAQSKIDKLQDKIEEYRSQIDLLRGQIADANSIRPKKP